MSEQYIYNNRELLRKMIAESIKENNEFQELKKLSLQQLNEIKDLRELILRKIKKD